MTAWVWNCTKQIQCSLIENNLTFCTYTVIVTRIWHMILLQQDYSSHKTRSGIWIGPARHAWIARKHVNGWQHCLPHRGLSWYCPPVLHCSQRSPASGWRTALWTQTCTGCRSHSAASPESLPPPGYHLCWLSANPKYMKLLTRCLWVN